MTSRTDALVIGAGPAGSATAILLARAGWEVVLVEQDTYPRRKVCGECITAGTLALLDELGIGPGVRAHAGPELRQIGWMSGSSTLIADFPICAQGPYQYGRVLRRDFLDGLLLDQARAAGVVVQQPARVRAVHGSPGAFHSDIESARPAQRHTIQSAVVIDAHGSWQQGPRLPADGQRPAARRAHLRSDLFAFKAVFENTGLEPGLLPVIALAGGYGGMAIADHGQTTLACCLRRDVLSACRASLQRSAAGEAVEALLRQRCTGVRQVLDGARRIGPWLAVGPLQPGSHHSNADGLFRIGNAAGESHPLVGEGIGMALQSATVLVHELAGHSPAAITAHNAAELQQRYATAWRRAFSRRLRVAAIYAHIAMRPMLASPARALLARWPALLTTAARLAGKARAFNSDQLHYGPA